MDVYTKSILRSLRRFFAVLILKRQGRFKDLDCTSFDQDYFVKLVVEMDPDQAYTTALEIAEDLVK